MNRVVFHIDVNSAFLSWTAVKILKEGGNQDIRSVPSVVSGDPSDRRSIITAASIPAKRLGITVWEVMKRVRAERHARTKAKAADCGMGVKEYIRIFGRRVTRKDGKRRPKTYAEICAYNKAHPLVDGWRR